MAISVLLLDDHPIITRGLANYLKEKTDIEVVGQLSNTEETLSYLQKYEVDVLISDMRLENDIHGVTFLLKLKSKFPDIKVIFYTMIEKISDVREAVLGGADGYVLKRYDADKVYSAILEVVANNKSYYSPDIVPLLAQHPQSGSKSEVAEPLRKFTSRELEIMKHIGDQKPMKEIAAMLDLQYTTVKTHRDKLKKKLGVKDNVGIYYYAHKYGVSTDEETES